MSRFAARSYLALFLCALSYLPGYAQSARQATHQNLPIVFEANQGQIPANYSYRFHRDGADAFFARNGVTIALDGKGEQPLQIDFVGGNASPRGTQQLAGHTNYFIGNDTSHWISNISLFSEVEYAELYRGISLGFYGNDRELEHDFQVAPGANPSQIALRIKGTTSASVQANGDLAMQFPSGTMVFRKPVAYQLSANGRESVRAAFRLSQNGEIHFELGEYDHSRGLVIDPVIVFSTYLAGTGTDEITAVTTDTSGDILVTGSTTSTDFPTQGAVQSSLGGAGATNVFVTKLDPSGKTLIYSTYLGGSSSSLGDFGGAIAVGPSGNAIVAGTSSSSNFPHAGAIPSANCQINNECYFIASIKPDGSALNYSGLIGGGQGSYTNGVNGRIAVDASGNAYLAGLTDDVNFNVTAGTLATKAIGYPYDEMFVLKVDSTGKIIYSTVVPGNASDPSDQPYTNAFLPTGIVVDSAGRVTVAGWGGLGLPTTSGVVGSQFPNPYLNFSNASAGVVLQLNATASAINFASYLPGTDSVGALTVDSSGNLWVAGSTSETTLPVSANAYQKTPSVPTNQGSGPYSGFIMEIAPGATRALAATYLDGSGTGQNDESSSFSAIALDSGSNVFVGGSTSSADFPMKDPFVTVLTSAGTISGMVLAEMSPDLSTVEFGSYFNATDGTYGGSNFGAMTLDAQNHLIATGVTFASDFPTTPGSFEPRLPPPASLVSTSPHSFVAKFDMSTPAPAVCFDSLSVSFGNVNANTSGSKTVDVTNCGNAPLSINTVTSSDPTVTASQSCGSMASGTVCPIQLTFTPVSSSGTSGYITLSDNAVTLPQTVSFQGQGIAPKISPQTNPVSFGHYVVGTQAPNAILFIGNQGQANLSISNVVVSGSNFSLVSQTCTQHSVSANSICVITLSFAPSSPGALSGTVTIASNDPQTPQLTVAINGNGDSIYAVPSLTSMSAPTVLINTAVTETLAGSNFYPQSVAQLNGTPLATSFLSATSLQATIPKGTITSLGEQTLTVVNPQPAGGTSAGVVVTPYQTLAINPAFLVAVPATGLLYAAIPTGASSNPNTIIPIDPTTGATKTPIAAGSNPSILAPSTDGSYLYVANQTDLTVQRINLQTNAVERTFPYTPNIYCSTCTNVPATDMAAVPGSPQEVLLSQGDWLTLYNDTGAVNHVPSDGICCFADPNFGSIALAGSPLTVYGLPFLLTGKFFQTANLTPTGLSYTRLAETNVGGNNTTGSQVISDGTLLYTSAGQIWNPATQTEVGTFPVTTFNTTSYPNLRNIDLDSSLGQFYTIGDQQVGNSDAVVITAYGLTSHAINATLMFPQIGSPGEYNLVRWGVNGLAFIAPGAGLLDQEVYLVRTSATSASTPNPMPVLNFVSPTSVISGGSSFTLTVNGSNFLANSVIDWNGVPLNTTFVSGQQLTAAVPASDITQPVAAQVAVYTPAPGGGSSASATLTIESPMPGASLSLSSLNFGNITQALSSSAQTVGLTNPGNAPLAITGMTTTGDFSATNNCGSSLAAGSSCTINLVFTPSTTGSRTGTLLVADSAPGSPQTVTLNGTGVAAFTIAAQQGGPTSLNVTSGNPATYNLAIAGGTGFSGTASLTCSGAPQYAACSVTPSSVNVTPGSSANFSVTVNTLQTVAANRTQRNITFAGLGLTPLFILGLLMRRKRPNVGLCCLLLAIFPLAFGISGCSSPSSANPAGGVSTQTYRTPPGTYTLTVTATVGAVTATQNLTLTVN